MLGRRWPVRSQESTGQLSETVAFGQVTAARLGGSGDAGGAEPPPPERGEVWRGLLCKQAMVTASLLCPAVQLLVLPSHLCPPLGQRSPFSFQPRIGPQAASQGPLFRCRPHFQRRFCRGPGELPGPRPHCSSLGASPLCCQGPSRLCPTRSCAEVTFGGCGGAGPLYTALALSFPASLSAERPCWQGPPPPKHQPQLPRWGTPPGSGRDEGCW